MTTLSYLLLLVQMLPFVSSQTEGHALCTVPSLIPTGEVYPANQCFDADQTSVSRVAMFKQGNIATGECTLVVSGCRGLDAELIEGSCLYLDANVPIVYYCVNGTWGEQYQQADGVTTVRCNW